MAENVCIICGKIFAVTGSSIYCGDECRNAAKREYYARYDAARVERRREYARERRAQMTREQRDRVNTMARANYAKRKAAAAAEQSKINENEVEKT